MKQRMDTLAITNRLKRIEGQIRGLIKMVSEEKSCEDILIQIGSAKSALHKTGQLLLEGYLSKCVLDGMREGKAEGIIKKMSSSLGQFSKIV